MLVIFQRNNGLFLSNLMQYRHLGTPQEVTDDQFLHGEVTNGAIFNHEGEVTDLRAFGRPADPASAAAAGDSFP